METDAVTLGVDDVLALQRYATQQLKVSLGTFMQATFAMLLRRYQGLGTVTALTLGKTYVL
jgi:hypothetical protein